LETWLELDRPFLILQARTDTGILGPDGKHGTTEKMSNNLPQTVGIDISKASLDCPAYPTVAERQLAVTVTCFMAVPKRVLLSDLKGVLSTQRTSTGGSGRTVTS
jgi:hypothetical protein